MNPKGIRSGLAVIAGVASAIIAGFLLVIAAMLAISGSEIRGPIIFAAISLYPLAIAIACFHPPWRTFTLRFLGGMTAIIMTAFLVFQLFKPLGLTNLRMIGFYLTMIIGSAVVAVKGKWSF